MHWTRGAARAPLALLLVALTEVVAHLWFAQRAPSFDAYGVLREPVAALHEPGDVVVVSPRWAEPMVRRALGEELMPLAAVAAPDLSTTRGVVEVSLFGQHSVELDGWREVSKREASSFVVRRLDNATAAPVTTDFVSSFGPRQATVSLNLRTATSCMFDPLAGAIAGDLGGHPTWPKARFVCPGPAHVTVGRTVIADQDWRPRRCVLAHPPARGELAIHYRAVRLGQRLVGHGGLSWMTERARRGAPIELRVEVDGTTIGSFIHADGDGWARFEMPVVGSTEALRDVSFFVSSPGELARDFCFEARSE